MTIRDENGFELIEHDFPTGRSVWAYFDGEKTILRTDYPVDQTINENAFARSEAKKDWSGDWHHVASIPLNLAYASGMHEAINQQDDAFVSRWLNNSDNKAWRTRDGTV